MINFDAIVKELSVVHDAVGISGIKREILGAPITDEDLAVLALVRRYEDRFEYSPIAKLDRFIACRTNYLHDNEPSPSLAKLLELSSQLIVADVTVLLRYFRKVEREISEAAIIGNEKAVVDRHLTVCAVVMNDAYDAQYKNVEGQRIRNFGSDADIDQADDDDAEVSGPPFVGYTLDDYDDDLTMDDEIDEDDVD